MSLSIKLALIFWVGVTLTVAGALVRINAHDMTWPREYSFSGPWQDTEWGRRQITLEECAAVAIAFGLGLLLLACHRWLMSPDPTSEH